MNAEDVKRVAVIGAGTMGHLKQGHLGASTSKGIYDYGGRTEAEILRKRDELFFKMLDHLEKIGAFEAV